MGQVPELAALLSTAEYETWRGDSFCGRQELLDQAGRQLHRGGRLRYQTAGH